MNSMSHDLQRLTSVQLEFQNEKWRVVIREDGQRYEYEFSVEVHARSFADGNRVRLGLYKIDEA
jgi:hypothetical protein